MKEKSPYIKKEKLGKNTFYMVHDEEEQRTYYIGKYNEQQFGGIAIINEFTDQKKEKENLKVSLLKACAVKKKYGKSADELEDEGKDSAEFLKGLNFEELRPEIKFIEMSPKIFLEKFT